MKRRVAVTGGGVISSLGDDWASTRACLLSKKNYILYMMFFCYILGYCFKINATFNQ